jgi:hypothetical protein
MISASHLANYAVKCDGLQIAWFLVEDDAKAFLDEMRFPEDYVIVELTRGGPSGSL